MKEEVLYMYTVLVMYVATCDLSFSTITHSHTHISTISTYSTCHTEGASVWLPWRCNSDAEGVKWLAAYNTIQHL